MLIKNLLTNQFTATKRTGEMSFNREKKSLLKHQRSQSEEPSGKTEDSTRTVQQQLGSRGGRWNQSQG